MDLREIVNGGVWAGFNWLRIVISGELVWTWQWTFEFDKNGEFPDQLGD